MVRQLAAVVRDYNPRDLLWVTVCDDVGMGFESCHVPFLTPLEWQRRTQADLASRLRDLLQRIGMDQCNFRLLSGSPNQVMADLAEEWGADLILAKEADVGKITGRDRLGWLWPSVPIPCAIQTVFLAPPWWKRLYAVLKKVDFYREPLVFPRKG